RRCAVARCTRCRDRDRHDIVARVALAVPPHVPGRADPVRRPGAIVDARRLPGYAQQALRGFLSSLTTPGRMTTGALLRSGVVDRDPDFLAECLALKREAEAFPTLSALRASPRWPELERRFKQIFSILRRYEPESAPPPSSQPDRLKAVHWNIE